MQFQARASDGEDDMHERQFEATASSAPNSGGHSAVASRLSALKARLEADKSRSAAPEAARCHINPPKSTFPQRKMSLV